MAMAPNVVQNDRCFSLPAGPPVLLARCEPPPLTRRLLTKGHPSTSRKKARVVSGSSA